MQHGIWHQCKDPTSAIIRHCRRFLIEREVGENAAYKWLRRSRPFMDVVRHFQAVGLTLFKIAAIIAYSDVHPLGEEALDVLKASIEGERSLVPEKGR